MILVGTVLGFLSGLFGVGGSAVATPVLRLLGISPFIALATPLPVALPTAVAGGYVYWKEGQVSSRIALQTALGGVPGVILGALFTGVVPGRALMAMTAIFVLGVGIRILIGLPTAEKGAPSKKLSFFVTLSIGFIVGVFSGLLANGGGFLLVPAYLLLYRMQPKRAAATSLVAVAFLALPGTIVHAHLGHIDWMLALWLTIGVLPFTWLGAKLALRLSVSSARNLFGVFMITFGLFFLIRTLMRVHDYGWLGDKQTTIEFRKGYPNK